MKHLCKRSFFIFSIMLILAFSATGLVSAAGYTNTYTFGKRVFKVVVSGSGTHIKSTVYEKKSSKDVKLASYKDISVHIVTLYGDYLYMTLGFNYDAEDIATSRLNIKTKKTTTVQKRAHISQIDGRYAIAAAPTGYPLALPYYVIDLKKGKSKSLSKKCYGAWVSGKKVYYYPVNSSYRGKVYECSVTLKNKKAVTGTIQSSEGYGTKVRSTFMAYGKRVNGTVKYYKYTYATKKKKQISSSDYWNIK